MCQINGKWKLTGSENTEAFLKAVGKCPAFTWDIMSAISLGETLLVINFIKSISF